MSNSFGLTKVKNIIAISSCKGGVGKSTVAAQLACQLASQGLKIGLLDTDIYGPSLPTLFDIHGETIYSNEFKMIIPLERNNLKLMSFGFLLGDAPAVMRGPIVTRYIQQLLFQTDWGELDYLLIDMPPGTGDVQLTITQSIKLTGAVIVTTRQALSLVDVARGILMFEKVSVPILGLVENMAYFLCDSCSKKHFIFGENPVLSLTKRFGVKTIGQLPIDREFTNNMVNFKPSAVIAELAKTLLEVVDEKLKHPTILPQIAFDQHQIVLSFDHGNKWIINNRQARLSCQCALCVDEISGKKLLEPQKIKLDVAPTSVTALGNYALAIEFNDGHASGIFPYPLLESIAQPS